MVTIRSSAGTNDESALSVVVLPEPVPPLTRMLRRARTARASRSRSGGSHVPAATRSSALIPRARKRRTVRIGPSGASGAMTTFTREPSGSRASHSGSASSTRRPSGARMRSIASRSSAADAKRTSVRSRRPARSTHTGPTPLTITSSTPGSRSNGSSGPNPNDALGHPRHQRLARAGVQQRRLALHQRPDPPLDVARAVRAPTPPAAARAARRRARRGRRQAPPHL